MSESMLWAGVVVALWGSLLALVWGPLRGRLTKAEAPKAESAVSNALRAIDKRLVDLESKVAAMSINERWKP